MISEKPYPLRFRPVLKRTIWGGEKLGKLLHKPIGDCGDYAESWEVVDHGEDQSVISNGPLEGTTIRDLMRQDSTWLLGSQSSETAFPLLLKYLDCNRVLSVQVHPDDEYGATMAVPDRGKTEAWYVVESDPESLIYAGLKPGVDREALAQAMDEGQTDRVLHSFSPSVGDCVFIPAGTVHALGAGLVIAEIQQSSDTTFRLFDWNRVDAEGNSRPLHVEQSLDVTDYQSGPVEARKSDPDQEGIQNLVSCDKFELSVLRIGEATLPTIDRPMILTVPNGRVELQWEDQNEPMKTGDTVMLPAGHPQCQLTLQTEGCALLATPQS